MFAIGALMTAVSSGMAGSSQRLLRMVTPMARGGDHDRTTAEVDSLLSQLTGAVSGIGAGELQDVLRRVLDGGSGGVDAFRRSTPPSRRRPRRLDVVTYRVRIDLKGTRPPLWRRLEVASDLFLGISMTLSRPRSAGPTLICIGLVVGRNIFSVRSAGRAARAPR
jgi:hypothetical protein